MVSRPARSAHPVTREEILRRFSGLNVWRRGDQRAPHKPLLLLLALGRITRKRGRLIPFTEVEEKLRPLLMEFGPPRKSFHPEYPFWRLQADGIWEVVGAEGAELRQGHTDPRVTELRRVDARGGMTTEIDTALRSNPELLRDVGRTLLEQSFPTSLHDEIAEAVGLDLGAPHTLPRDRRFRDRVLIAYGYSCAVCGYDLRLQHAPVGLEAAHIKWRQAGGPATEDNGLALCTLHHKLFDRGVLTLDEDRHVLVSPLVNGSSGFKEWVERYNGQPIRNPRRMNQVPLEEYVRWHVRQVFKSG